MASFGVWVPFAQGKYLKGLCCQPQDVTVIRFDFEFHIGHSPEPPLLRQFAQVIVI
jgi:hypothetical protein